MERMLTALGLKVNQNYAEIVENEIAAEFKDVAMVMLDLIEKSDTGISKRGFQQCKFKAVYTTPFN